MTSPEPIFTHPDLVTILKALEETAIYNYNLSRKYRNSRSREIQQKAREYESKADHCGELQGKIVEFWVRSGVKHKQSLPV